MFGPLAQSSFADLPELDRLPGWINIDLLLNITLAVATVWVVLTAFIYWRRSVTNLTPVEAATANKKAQPAFLKVDKKARKAALKRGDAYERQLTKREQQQRRLAQNESPSFSTGRRIIGYIALAAAAISLITIAVGCLFPTSLPGQWLNHYSSEGRLTEIIQANPITIPVSLLVIGCCVGRFVLGRKSSLIQIEQSM